MTPYDYYDEYSDRTFFAAVDSRTEVERLAYNAGLAGAPFSSVAGRVSGALQSDAEAYWQQGTRDTARTTVTPPEMSAESRAIASAVCALEAIGCLDIKVTKIWEFNRYKYATSFCNQCRRYVALRADLDDLGAAVEQYVTDELSRRKVSALFAA